MANAVDLKKTTIQLNEVSQGESQIWVAGVSLPVPKQIIGESQVNHLKASDSGLKEVDQARQRKGWTRVDLSWVKAAKTPASILQRFVVEYTAPLKKNYASCVGQAISEELTSYKFRFGSSNVSFRVELPPDSPSTPSAFSAQTLVGGRPYVRWAIAD